jgi:solute carrier family 25 uncoupling protein 27
LGIAKEEGWRMLWRGMLPALLRHAIYTGTRMSAYEEIRTSVTRNNSDPGGFPMWKKVLVGMSAGGFGQFVASPTDLVKTQLQVRVMALHALCGSLA